MTFAARGREGEGERVKWDTPIVSFHILRSLVSLTDLFPRGLTSYLWQWFLKMNSALIVQHHPASDNHWPIGFLISLSLPSCVDSYCPPSFTHHPSLGGDIWIGGGMLLCYPLLWLICVYVQAKFAMAWYNFLSVQIYIFGWFKICSSIYHFQETNWHGWVLFVLNAHWNNYWFTQFKWIIVTVSIQMALRSSWTFNYVSTYYSPFPIPIKPQCIRKWHISQSFTWTDPWVCLKRRDT